MNVMKMTVKSRRGRTPTLGRTFATMKESLSLNQRPNLVAKTNVSCARTMEIATQAAVFGARMGTGFVVRDVQMNLEASSMGSVLVRVNARMG